MIRVLNITLVTETTCVTASDDHCIIYVVVELL